MKIYFAGSIRGGRDDAAVYEAMIAFLRSFGEVLTEHVGDLDLSETGDDGPDDRFIYDRDMAWLSVCDVVVAEVTTPSLGVGYELGRAIAMNKPVLCLYRPQPGRTLSALIAGCPDLITIMYQGMKEAQSYMASFIRKAADLIGERRDLKDRPL